jgi:NadR type nicotinamide-nucleotide adenylyltransferase
MTDGKLNIFLAYTPVIVQTFNRTLIQTSQFHIDYQPKILYYCATMSVQTHKLTKIAIVGPESTGKSTMAQYLANNLGTVCVPEYARYYCRNLNRQYTLQDEINMFHGQLSLEEALSPLAKNNILICDTTILTVKVWCDHLFGGTPVEIKTEITRRRYDLYLIMDIDLPWEDDPLRDFPDQREHFRAVWEQELQAINANYTIASGLGINRLRQGLENVRSFLKHHKT